MHRGLPLVWSIELVSFSSSELKFGTSVNSTTLVWTSCSSFLDSGFTFRSSLSFVMLTWTSEVSSSGSWMSSYVPSTSDSISIYAMQYSKLVKCLSIALRLNLKVLLYWVIIYRVKVNTTNSIK